MTRRPRSPRHSSSLPPLVAAACGGSSAPRPHRPERDRHGRRVPRPEARQERPHRRHARRHDDDRDARRRRRGCPSSSMGRPRRPTWTSPTRRRKVTFTAPALLGHHRRAHRRRRQGLPQDARSRVPSTRCWTSAAGAADRPVEHGAIDRRAQRLPPAAGRRPGQGRRRDVRLDTVLPRHAGPHGRGAGGARPRRGARPARRRHRCEPGRDRACREGPAAPPGRADVRRSRPATRDALDASTLDHVALGPAPVSIVGPAAPTRSTAG